MREMIVHHSICIGGGLAVMLDKVYGNFTLYGLTMEVNSIFLHARALLQMCNKRDTAAFKMVSLLNILVILLAMSKQVELFVDQYHSQTGSQLQNSWLGGPEWILLR